MKFLYLDKRERIQAWFTPKHTAMAAGILGLVLGIPVWKESVAGKFALEPVNQAVVRAHVPGAISQIFVREGQVVLQGSPLATLSNLPVQSGLHDARVRMLLAAAQSKEAALNYQGYGSALMESQRSAKQYAQISDMSAALELKAPIAGTVLTPKIQDQLGAYLKAGGELLEIADLSRMRARIYISEFDLHKIQTGQPAKLQFDGVLRRTNGEVNAVSARPTEAPLIETDQAESDPNSAQPHQFYFVDIVVENSSQALKPGMSGVARVYGGRRSLGGMALEDIKNFWGRKLW